MKKWMASIALCLLATLLACSACGKKKDKASEATGALLAMDPEQVVWMDGSPAPTEPDAQQETSAPNLPEPGITAGEIAPSEGAVELFDAGMVAVSSLDVHVAANSASDVGGKLNRSTRVQIVGQVDRWYYVRTQNIEGYVLGEYIQPVNDVVRPETASILFYDSIAQRYVDVEKTFYWAQFEGKPRRFDGKLPPQVFRVDEGGLFQISDEVQATTKNMARALYNTDAPRVTCYFGQYYPSATREDGMVYETGIHEGIDFAGPAMDAEFYSLTDGTVTSVQVGTDHAQYNWIAVYTGDLTVFYIHNTSSFVQVGDAVTKGQRLGTQGDYGSQGAYHVHVEVVNGDAETFNRSKDAELVDDSPYDFWKSQGY